MSCWPEAPNHFLEWARERQAQGSGCLALLPPVRADSFLPRAIYGEYLAQQLAQARMEAPRGVTFNVITQEAVDLHHNGRQALVLLQNGQVVFADQVVLALGVLPSEYPVQKPLKFFSSQRYVHFAWNRDRWRGLEPDDEVLLVGQGLTSIDLALELADRDHRGRIHLLSRRGFRPKEHRWEPPWRAFVDAKNLPATVREAIRVVRANIKAAEASGAGFGWRSVLDSLRPVTPAIWQNWPMAERARFLRHLRPIWEAHRHRVCPEVGAWMQDLANSGRVHFLAGRIRNIVEESGVARVEYRDRRSQQIRELRVAKVVNCTGPLTDYTKYQHPLLVSLLAQGIITHDPLALGVEATADGMVKGFDHRPLPWLHTLGALLQGVLWETVAIPEIRGQAARLAEVLAATVPAASVEPNEVIQYD